MPFEIELRNFSIQDSGDTASEEYWYSIRRCAKCKAFYSEIENQSPNNTCSYHPGSFTDTNRITSGVFVGWNCCRFVNPSYTDPNSKGCKIANKHVEDRSFTEIMQLFPYDEAANREDQLKKVLNEEESKKNQVTKKPTNFSVMPELEELIQHPDYITHQVTRADTLAGLALKYKTTTSTIKRVNRMPNDLVFQRDVIFIPKTAGCTQPIPSIDKMPNSSKIGFFVSRTGCAKEEAKFYLEESDWDVDTAVKSWKEDMSWSNTKN